MKALRSSLWAGVALVACAHGGGGPASGKSPSSREKPPAWEVVFPQGGWVFEDPAAGRVHVLDGGRVLSFPTGAGAPRALLQVAAAGAQWGLNWRRAELTAAGAPRWYDGEGWHGAHGRLALPHAPSVQVAARALLHVPADGPGAGLPRVLCVFGEGADLPAADAEAILRDETVLAVSSGGAHRIDVGACEARRLALPEGRLLAVAPGLDPLGRWGAVALAGPEKGARVVLLDGEKVARVVELPGEPSALHVGAGALFAQEARPEGALLRLDLGTPAEGALSTREEAVLRHRRGMLVALQEALDAADPVRAADVLDVLALDGLVEETSAQESELLARAAALVRPRLEEAGRRALAEGRTVLALALDRRAVLLDGKGFLENAPRPPPLRVAVSVAEDMADPVQIDAARADLGFEVVIGCPDAPGQDACLEIVLDADATDPGPALAANGAALRREAERAFDARAQCLDDGQVVLDDTPAGPRSAFACDLLVGGGRRAVALAALLAERARLSRAARPRAALRLADGTRRDVALPPVEFPQSLQRALDAALALQGQADLLAARRAGGVPAEAERALRTILWRGEAADEDLRAAVRGDGQLRAPWIGGR